MKTLFRILIILSFVAIVYYYSSNSNYEYEPLEGPNSSSQVIPKTDTPQNFKDALPRPESGLSTYIDKDSEILYKKFGKPNRYDKTSYGYEWWVYNKDSSSFVMFGVEDRKITQVYISGESLDATPYKIGQSLDDIYRMTIVDTEVTAQIDDNIYTFSMNEEDMRSRILTKFDGLFAQLYIDSEREKLSGIRFTDAKTLVLHRPYEMSFVGDLLSPPNPSSYLLEESNKSSADELFDLTNAFRVQNNVPPLNSDNQLTNEAMMHSEDMYTQNYLSHNSPTYGSLKERLKDKNILYDNVGENLATAYFDAIEAAHGWLNSNNHREVLLDEKFSHVGSGVFINYYTQIFIEKETNEENKDQIQS